VPGDHVARANSGGARRRVGIDYGAGHRAQRSRCQRLCTTRPGCTEGLVGPAAPGYLAFFNTAFVRFQASLPR
jgi:hypothetical protein